MNEAPTLSGECAADEHGVCPIVVQVGPFVDVCTCRCHDTAGDRAVVLAPPPQGEHAAAIGA